MTSPPIERPLLPPSPCVGICALKGDYCYGCGRTADEIAAWGTMPAARQSSVWAELPARLAAFGFKTFRLAAGPAVVSAFIARTFTEATGRWRIVSPGVEGSVAVTADDRPDVDEDAGRVTATFADGSRLTLVKHDKVRVFGFASHADAPRMDTVALVLPKGRAQRDLKEAAGVDTAFAPRPPRDAFAEVHATASGQRWLLRNALGCLESGALTTGALTFHDAIDAEANAPPDVKISKAFVAGAIFHADDPAWLAAALAP